MVTRTFSLEMSMQVGGNSMPLANLALSTEKPLSVDSVSAAIKSTLEILRKKFDAGTATAFDVTRRDNTRTMLRVIQQTSGLKFPSCEQGPINIEIELNDERLELLKVGVLLIIRPITVYRDL